MNQAVFHGSFNKLFFSKTLLTQKLNIDTQNG